MSKKSKIPPLWMLPILLRYIPPMIWAQHRKNYMQAMKIGRKLLGSPKIRTKAFQGYTPSKHDVFVCTYSKSGTYWTMQIVTQIAGRGEATFESIHDLVPWPESPMPTAARLGDPTWEETPTQLRAVKTHAEAQYVPYNSAAKYVVVIRDPKDALISSFHFSESIMPGVKSIGLDKWTDAFVKGETPFSLWAEHTAGFWPWRNRENVLVLTFAEMKQDLETAVRRLATLMNVDLTDVELEKVVEKSSFAYMKANEAQFAPPSPVATKEPIELIRKGKTGEFAKALTPAQQAQVDRTAKADLQRLGSDFPYDAYYCQEKDETD